MIVRAWLGAAQLLILAKVCQLIVGVLSIRLLTEILPKSELSFYFIAMSTISFFTFMFYNPIGQLVSREASTLKRYNGLKTVIDLSLMYRFMIIGIALIICICLYSLSLAPRSIKEINVSLPLALGLLASFNAYFLSLINITLGRSFFALCQIVTVLVSGVVATIGLFYFKSALGWMLPLFIVQVLFSIVFYCKLAGRSKSSQRIKKLLQKPKIRSRIKKFIFPVAFILVLQWILIHSYRFLIDLTSGVEVLAVIGVLTALSASLFAAIESLLNQFFISVYYRKISSMCAQERISLWYEYSKVIIPIYIFFATTLIVNSEVIFAIFLAEPYRNFFYLFLGVALFDLGRVIMNYIYLIVQVEYAVNRLRKPYLFTSLLMLLLLWLSGSLEGEEWLFGVVMSFSGVFLLVYSIYSVKNSIRIQFPVSSIFRAILACLLMVVVSCAAKHFIGTKNLIDVVIVLTLNGSVVVSLVCILLYKDFRKLFSKGLV